MANTNIDNLIDCANLNPDGIDIKIKELISKGVKNIALKTTNDKKNLIEGNKGQIKIETLEGVGEFFANYVEGLKILVNGNVGDNSANGVKNSKFTVFGSTENNFGNNSKNSEFYIRVNGGKNLFSNLSESSKVVIGGQCASSFGENIKDSVIVVLNLLGGNIFIDKNIKWFTNSKNAYIYLRGDVKISTDELAVEKASECDEDIYLPLISEFARLFRFSLSEIKSKDFYRVRVK